MDPFEVVESDFSKGLAEMEVSGEFACTHARTYPVNVPFHTTNRVVTSKPWGWTITKKQLKYLTMCPNRLWKMHFKVSERNKQQYCIIAFFMCRVLRAHAFWHFGENSKMHYCIFHNSQKVENAPFPDIWRLSHKWQMQFCHVKQHLSSTCQKQWKMQYCI